MVSNMTRIEAIHAELQELESQYRIREKDIIEMFHLIEELRERFESNG